MVAGSTSVGKTELSLRLATLLNGEVISADSAQVNRSKYHRTLAVKCNRVFLGLAGGSNNFCVAGTVVSLKKLCYIS